MVSRYRPGPRKGGPFTNPEPEITGVRRWRLLERDADLDSAGALLYESAKQCINAVANQEGINPRPHRRQTAFPQ